MTEWLVNSTDSEVVDSEAAEPFNKAGSEVVDSKVAEPFNKAGSEVYASIYLYLSWYFNLIPSKRSFPPLDQSQHGLVSTPMSQPNLTGLLQKSV